MFTVIEVQVHHRQYKDNDDDDDDDDDDDEIALEFAILLF